MGRNPTGIFKPRAPLGSSGSWAPSGNGRAAPCHVATVPLPTARGPSAGYLQPALASQWELERTYQPFVMDTLFGPMLPALSLLEMPPEYRRDFPLPSHPLSYLSVLSPDWYGAWGQLTCTDTTQELPASLEPRRAGHDGVFWRRALHTVSLRSARGADISGKKKNPNF